MMILAEIPATAHCTVTGLTIKLGGHYPGEVKLFFYQPGKKRQRIWHHKLDHSGEFIWDCDVIRIDITPGCKFVLWAYRSKRIAAEIEVRVLECA